MDVSVIPPIEWSCMYLRPLPYEPLERKARVLFLSPFPPASHGARHTTWVGRCVPACSIKLQDAVSSEGKREEAGRKEGRARGKAAGKSSGAGGRGLRAPGTVLPFLSRLSPLESTASLGRRSAQPRHRPSPALLSSRPRLPRQHPSGQWGFG